MNFIWVLSIPRTTLQFPPKKPNWSWKTSMQLGSEVSKGFSKMMVIACLDSEFKVLEKWYEKHLMRLNQWLSALSFLIFLWGGGLDVFGWCVWCISASGRYLLLVIEHVWSHQLVWEKTIPSPMKSPTAQQLQSSSVVHMIQKKLYNAHSNHGAGIYIYIYTYTCMVFF